MSDQLMHTFMPRHALLFELIRQRDMAEFVNRKIRSPRQADPLESHQFMLQAEQSFAPKGVERTLF